MNTHKQIINLPDEIANAERIIKDYEDMLTSKNANLLPQSVKQNRLNDIVKAKNYIIHCNHLIAKILAK